ncbi:MAG: 2-C-methyl-D-erythritol 4-phosphate cytidylyltransferase [Candidatus Marinimicrobia bacterium]|nr:2-C-methyl-D-erythritol 4-phosphate cytidylyltransferase [Candidatus Neomarinimicrobiota bacterium]|tara:strand:+ start:33221 stop:33919 length:699 start_codon:yes stop_codon:yes gene_type:complete
MPVTVGAIVAAAGDGQRFSKKGDKRKKQFISLGGKPLFLHSVISFYYSPIISRIIVVVPSRSIEFCTNFLHAEFGSNDIEVIAGGAKRQDSVYKAFVKIKNSVDTVIIQDGARPFMDPSWIASTVNKIKTYDGAIVAQPALDTIKLSHNSLIKETLDRSLIWQAQTPQTFTVDILETAFDYAKRENFVGTDESQIVEKVHGNISLIEGTSFNLKITTQSDLVLAQSIFSKGL